MTQAYPGLKPYLKGFHLSLETWQGGRDSEGWKGRTRETNDNTAHLDMQDVKRALLTKVTTGRMDSRGGPPGGFTLAVPRFREDLEALTILTQGERLAKRCVWSQQMLTAYYSFGDASLAGFGATVKHPDGLHGRFGLWGRDEEDQSSNYRELRNLVENIEEEALSGYLMDGELWIFTDNSTAESCFFKGGSSSKLLHKLVLWLRKVELNTNFMLHVVHVVGTRMIAQGTDRLLQGTFLEGVVGGQDMLSFIDLSRSAVKHHPPICTFVESWLDPVLGPATWLRPKEWFVEGHGIVDSQKDSRGIWIPTHARNGKAYIWAPPPVIAKVALEECLKAVHKRMDAYHVFLIPRLYSPLWLCMFYRLSNFVFYLSPGSLHWPAAMHEPLFVGIALPTLSRPPWTLQRMP